MSVGTIVRSQVRMGTSVSIEVVGTGTEVDAAIDRAFEWFGRIEAVCSRFDPDSELRLVSARTGSPVEVSPILFEAVQFAVAVAEETGGAFDPTVGHAMEARGFNREYSTGHRTVRRADLQVRQTPGLKARPTKDVSYRDIELDTARLSITLRQPLTLDLGAVAKGLAVDTAARELHPFEHFAIDAGGDLYLGGRNPSGEPWSVGIRHPRLHDQVLERIRVSNKAVCTSGDYERGAHILDPAEDRPASGVASVTVVASTAMLADALATAAFVLGPDEGLRLLERQGVEGLIVTPELGRRATQGFGRG